MIQVKTRFSIIDFAEIILEKPSHVLCSLCHNREDADVKTSDGTKEDNSNDKRGANNMCYCCRQYLSTGKTIADGATNVSLINTVYNLNF